MARKKLKYRQYPSLTRQQFQIEVMKQPQVKTFDEYNPIENTVDVSIATMPSKVSLSLMEMKRHCTLELSYENILKEREQEFIDLLLSEDFSDSVRNETTYYLSKLRKGKTHKKDVNEWILKLYMNHLDNQLFILQLFRMFSCFSYDYFYPASLILVGLGVHNESDFVKSEALSLLDHWGNADVFNLMNYHEPPQTPWLREKYLAVKKSLEEYAAIQKD